MAATQFKVGQVKAASGLLIFLVENMDDVGGHLGRRTEAGEQQEDASSRKHINLTFD